MRQLSTLVLTLAGTIGLAAVTYGQKTAGARINNLKVLSDKIDDVTTADNILKSFVKAGMSDAQRAKALWRAAVKYRHQTAPPNEFLAADWEAHDPVKLFNVYGYCMCCCSSALIEALNRLDGRRARGRILNGHSVPEVCYSGAWHMFDASLITYFPKPKTGEVASVDEISGALASWYAKNPGYRKNGAKLAELMRGDGWRAWKSKGPELLAHCPYYHLGFLPARTHGWNDTMVEYDRKSEVYEYGYQVGHRALFSLRPGESMVREAGNRGLHVNMLDAATWDGLKARAPDGDLTYVKEFFPGFRGRVVGNGRHRYHPDLASGGLAAGAETYENLASGSFPALQVKKPGKPGVAVIQMSSPYVYLGGELMMTVVRKTASDRVAVSISTNYGRTFQPLWTMKKTGTAEAVVDLRDRIFRRYVYWLKIEIAAARQENAGLEKLAIENDIQHAPRTLPWLGKGKNTITVAADCDQPLATRTIACRITADPKFNKNETAAGMGIKTDNLDLRYDAYWWKGGIGAMIVPVETPGDMVAVRFGVHGRARGTKDVIKMQVSFDGGKTWKEAAQIKGPTQGRTEYFRYARIPAGTRSALLRYQLTGNNTVGILSFRVDADYKDPLAQGAPRPFDVIYRWKENGKEKTERFMVKKLPFKYGITTKADPEMVSVTSEMPAK
jgi:hypothetical protein